MFPLADSTITSAPPEDRQQSLFLLVATLGVRTPSRTLGVRPPRERGRGASAHQSLTRKCKGRTRMSGSRRKHLKSRPDILVRLLGLFHVQIEPERRTPRPREGFIRVPSRCP